VRPVPRVIVAVDTSGSMTEKDLSTALRETRGVMKAVGASVEFCACDAQVHTLKKVDKWEELPSLLKGGGGTDFVPVFNAVDKLNPRPEVLVFVTDGCGPAPVTPPPGLKVIWLLVGNYRHKPVPWGEYIEVED
jgi:predicted metal-dependent peptidase